MAAVMVEYASVWDKVLTGQALAAGEEARRGIVLFNMLMTDSEGRFLHFNTGYLDARSWEGRRSILLSMANLPIYEAWRTSGGARSHSVEFLEMLDNLVGTVPDK